MRKREREKQRDREGKERGERSTTTENRHPNISEWVRERSSAIHCDDAFYCLCPSLFSVFRQRFLETIYIHPSLCLPLVHLHQVPFGGLWEGCKALPSSSTLFFLAEKTGVSYLWFTTLLLPLGYWVEFVAYCVQPACLHSGSHPKLALFFLKLRTVL